MCTMLPRFATLCLSMTRSLMCADFRDNKEEVGDTLSELLFTSHHAVRNSRSFGSFRRATSSPTLAGNLLQQRH